MLHGRLLRSPLPHARIVEHRHQPGARALPGVKAVITGKRHPAGHSYGNWRLMPDTQDEYALAMDKVRFIGDEVAAVAAIDRDTADEALDLIQVDYEELPGRLRPRRGPGRRARRVHARGSHRATSASPARSTTATSTRASPGPTTCRDDIFTVQPGQPRLPGAVLQPGAGRA